MVACRQPDALMRIAAMRRLQQERATALLGDAIDKAERAEVSRAAASARLVAAQEAWERLQARPRLDLALATIGARSVVERSADIATHDTLVHQAHVETEQRENDLKAASARSELAAGFAKRAARGVRRQCEEAALATLEDRMAERGRR
jgi:hypothetical protein